MYRATLFTLVVTGLASCVAHYVNAQQVDARQIQYALPKIPSEPPKNSDKLFMLLTFFGGGARAAALSYGVLEALATTQVTHGRHEHRLLDEVDLISAVSGGSFTAAYYGLFGDRIFKDYEERYLKNDAKSALSALMLSPLNWWRLASPYFHRSDLAAEHYNTDIFDGGTLGDISACGTPVIINATNMAEGTVFRFDQEQFDWICLDLMSFPVSRAVAASSAVPVLMSPITLQNNAGECGYDPPSRMEKVL